MRLSLLAVLLPCVVASPRLSAQETYAAPVEGFLARDALSPAFKAVGVGGLSVLPGGDVVVYVEGELRLEGREESRAITEFDPPVFGSFVVAAPEGDSVYFGESSEWKIYRVPISGGAPLIVDELVNAYDLKFDPAGRGFLSVLTKEPGNQILLLDEDPALPNRAVVTNIPGVSGPIAFDDEGNLFYGTAEFGDPIRQTLHRFARDQIDGALEGEPLDFAEGELLLDEMDGFYQLGWHEGKLYFTELGYKAGVGSIQEIDPARNYSVSPVATFPIDGGVLSPTYFTFRSGPRPFAAGSGPLGGSLFVSYSNYSSILRVAEIYPQLYFLRGELNGDGLVDISDAIALLGHLFLGGPSPRDIEAADANSDGEIDLSDALYVLEFLFSGGPSIPPPYPEWGPAPPSVEPARLGVNGE